MSEDPFKPGVAYRVRRDFAALRDRFSAGEILVYVGSEWSRYDGITCYLFRLDGCGDMRWWDVRDEDDLDIRKELFEEIPA